MNNLNERQQILLRLLLTKKAYRTIKAYAKELRVSYKTVANDVKVLANWLHEYDIKLETKPHKGIRLLVNNKQLQTIHYALHHYYYQQTIYYSVESRREQIYLQYLWNSDRSIQKFSDMYFVSPTSIIKDLEVVDKKLQVFNLSMHRSTKGTRLQGNEINIRKALVSYMEMYLYHHSAKNDRYQMLDKVFKDIHLIEVENIEDILSFLEEQMKDIEKISDTIINEPYYTNAFLYLVVMILRIKMGLLIQTRDELAQSEDDVDAIDFLFTKQLIKKIEDKYKIQINEAEAINIYRHIMSGGLSKEQIAIVEKNTKDNNLNSLTLAYTKYLIEHMSLLFGIDFSNQIYVHSSLRFHIKPMINRLRYDIQVNNGMLEEIKKRYPLEFILTKVSTVLTSQRYELPIPSDAEVTYIMVYFQSAMERKGNAIRSMLVSGNSVGSTQLLKTRLENRIQGLIVEDILPPSKLNQVQVDNIDLILSTSEVSINLPYLLLSDFCDQSDVMTIQHYIDSLNKQRILHIEDLEIVSCQSIKSSKGVIKIEVLENLEVWIRFGKGRNITYAKQEKQRIYCLEYQDLQELNPLLRYLLMELPIKLSI